MDLRKLLNQENVNLVDVREPWEFEAGHALRAVNIPLTSLPSKLEALKLLEGPILLYCRSGMRSAQAMGLLKSMGLDKVYNAGSLNDVIYYQAQAV